MVLGLYHCTGKPNGKEAAYAAIRSFESRFRDHFGSTRCIDLVQCDLNTEKGKELYHTGELHERVCEKCIGAAVEVVEEMMFLKGGVRS
ncbi:MAG: C_GCAxxG_C_C family protein, partial [Bacteroidales bacterium]|nr:C_GCAxxG_C_C family protein [Bacteroidales bacterium]